MNFRIKKEKRGKRNNFSYTIYEWKRITPLNLRIVK